MVQNKTIDHFQAFSLQSPLFKAKTNAQCENSRRIKKETSNYKAQVRRYIITYIIIIVIQENKHIVIRAAKIM